MSPEEEQEDALPARTKPPPGRPLLLPPAPAAELSPSKSAVNSANTRAASLQWSRSISRCALRGGSERGREGRGGGGGPTAPLHPACVWPARARGRASTCVGCRARRSPASRCRAPVSGGRSRRDEGIHRQEEGSVSSTVALRWQTGCGGCDGRASGHQQQHRGRADGVRGRRTGGIVAVRVAAKLAQIELAETRHHRATSDGEEGCAGGRRAASRLADWLARRLPRTRPKRFQPWPPIEIPLGLQPPASGSRRPRAHTTATPSCGSDQAMGSPPSSFSLQWSTVGLTDSEATRLTPDPTGWASHLESPPLVCLRRRPCCRRSEVAGRGNGFPPRGITLMCRLSPFLLCFPC